MNWSDIDPKRHDLSTLTGFVAWRDKVWRAHLLDQSMPGGQLFFDDDGACIRISACELNYVEFVGMPMKQVHDEKVIYMASRRGSRHPCIPREFVLSVAWPLGPMTEEEERGL